MLVVALDELAHAVHNRPRAEQHSAIVATAARHGLEPDVLARLARDVGAAARRRRPSFENVRGRGAFNILRDADIPALTRAVLARQHLRWAASVSDPDRPRLWMLANALAHAVPVRTLLTTPATAHYPAVSSARRHDLVGWYGLRPALHHLDATVTAARSGRRWLARATSTSDNVLIAVGVLDLTHPGAALELVRTGPAAVRLTDLRHLLDRVPVPTSPRDLTDAALTATCLRNGWLLGTADEHNGIHGRHAVGHSGIRGSTITQAHQLTAEASREALRRFADLVVHPHRSVASAHLARFPDQALRHVLDPALRANSAVTGHEIPPPAHLYPSQLQEPSGPDFPFGPAP